MISLSVSIVEPSQSVSRTTLQQTMSFRLASLVSPQICGIRPALMRKPFPSISQQLMQMRFKLQPQRGLVLQHHLAAKRVSLPQNLWKAAGLVGAGIGISSFGRSSIRCDVPEEPVVPPAPREIPPPPPSSVSLYELSFGTVAGICAGVFIKKGAKAVAWFLGGIFVLLQYLGSTSLVRVDWARMASKFENLFYTKDAVGSTRPPTVVSLWRWLVDFLTADFQPRASFLAGLALGIRIG
ncbi:FUN14 family-domain-containing protein [Infundibulicybe gibba]|nr:FUN14 family-domain-containing protein [Infundibulicybe gibba]